MDEAIGEVFDELSELYLRRLFEWLLSPPPAPEMPAAPEPEPDSAIDYMDFFEFKAYDDTLLSAEASTSIDSEPTGDQLFLYKEQVPVFPSLYPLNNGPETSIDSEPRNFMVFEGIPMILKEFGYGQMEEAGDDMDLDEETKAGDDIALDEETNNGGPEEPPVPGVIPHPFQEPL